MTLTEDEIPLVIRALEQYYAFTATKKSTDERYRALAERLQPKKPAASVSPEEAEEGLASKRFALEVASGKPSQPGDAAASDS